MSIHLTIRRLPHGGLDIRLNGYVVPNVSHFELIAPAPGAGVTRARFDVLVDDVTVDDIPVQVEVQPIRLSEFVDG